jgi:hypothetical protein
MKVEEFQELLGHKVNKKVADALNSCPNFEIIFDGDEAYCNNVPLECLFDDESEEKGKEKLDKHTKGYMFDSLVYRYKLARAGMSEAEFLRPHRASAETIKFTEERDVRRFIEILHEAIREHD